jgi:2-(1,2-epoxy-1,2-dihydrophenyl)acetyl-CoA isomerase
MRTVSGTAPDLVKPRKAIVGRCLALARKLATGPTRALVATRRLIEKSEHSTYAEQFRREIETQAEIRRTADALEGRNAFLEKRAARFSGR